MIVSIRLQEPTYGTFVASGHDGSLLRWVRPVRDVGGAGKAAHRWVKQECLAPAASSRLVATAVVFGSPYMYTSERDHMLLQYPVLRPFNSNF